MMNAIWGVAAQGFVAGILSGTIVFLLSWAMAGAMNIIKFPMKGGD